VASRFCRFCRVSDFILTRRRGRAVQVQQATPLHSRRCWSRLERDVEDSPALAFGALPCAARGWQNASWGLGWLLGFMLGGLGLQWQQRGGSIPLRFFAVPASSRYGPPRAHGIYSAVNAFTRSAWSSPTGGGGHGCRACAAACRMQSTNAGGGLLVPVQMQTPLQHKKACNKGSCRSPQCIVKLPLLSAFASPSAWHPAKKEV